jgi:autotransporter-associated beta strand protein
MMNEISRRNNGARRWTQALTMTLSFLAQVAFSASTDTWVGGSGNNFSTTANWTYSSGSGPVASGDSLTFSGAGSTTPNNDETGFTYGNITFSGTTVYTIGGNSFTLGSAGSIANSAAVTQTINNNIALTGSGGTINPSIASAGITLGGVVNGSANLTKSGNTTGTLTLSGVNTFSGVLNLNAGVVIFSTPPSVSGGNLGNPSGITFGGSSTTTLQTSAGAGAVTISSPTITVSASSTGLFKNGATTGTYEISAKITGAGNCKQNSPTTTGAVVRFSNDTSDYTGNFSMAAGVVEFTSVANGGTASCLGAAGTAYAIINSSSAATFRYVGAGTVSTTRNVDWQGTTGGLTLDSGATASGPVIAFLGSGNLRSANGAATLTLSGSSTGANTLAQVINDGTSGAATSVTKSGTGLWILSGANTYSGGTTLNTGGTIGIGNALALGSGALVVAQNGLFDNATGGPLTIANALTMSGGSPTFTGSANLAINGAVTISGANRTLTVSANTLTLGNAIGDSGQGRSFTKAGNGTLVLGGASASTYSGGTVVSAGSLQISGSATLGSSGSALTVSAGTLDLGGTSQNVGTVTISGASTIQNGTLNGTTYLGTLGSGMAVESAVLDGGGATLSHSGGGTLALLGVNTYSGGTTISGAGTILLTNDAGLGNASAGLTFSASGTLAATNNAAASNTTVSIGSTRTITVNNGIIANFNTPDTNNLTVAAKVTGAGSVTKKSSSFSLGNVRFSNDTSDYTGDFTAGFGNTEFTSVAEQGTASSLGAGAVGTGGQITINNATSSGTMRYVGSGNSSTHRPLVWSGTTGTYTLDASGGGTIAFLGTGGLKTGSGNEELRLRGSNTGTNTLAQCVNDLGGTTLINKFDAGTWVLAGTNTFSGGVTNNAGILQVNATETSGTSGPLGKSGAITCLGGALQYSPANNTDYSARFSTAPNQSYKIDCNGQSVTFASGLAGAGSSLTVSSSSAGGTLTLTAAGSYTGNTTIRSGTLALSGSGSISNSPAISIAAGAIFDVSGGYMLGTQTLYATNGATATINGSLNLGSASLVMANTPNTPTINVTGGTLTLATGNAVAVSINNGGTRLAAGSYKIISASGGGAVGGTAPASVIVGGDGIAVGAGAQLEISGQELYLVVCAPPTAIVRSADSATASCPGTSVTIHADLTGTSPWNVTWSDGTVQTGVSASPASLSVAPNTTTTYTVTALSDSCAGAGSASDSATVTVATNLPPMFSAALSASTIANHAVTIANVKFMTLASDPELQPLTLSGVSPTSAQGGTVAMNGSTNVTFSPAADYVGADSFTYWVSDGCKLATNLVNVTVTSSNALSLNVVFGPTIDGSDFVVRFAGIPGYTYTIEYGDGVTGPWTKKTNQTASTDNQGYGPGIFEFRESTLGVTQRYYRTVYPAY